MFASALMVMHRLNLYHGDLKPSNLCFRNLDQLEVVIVDFGHAGFLEENILERSDKIATLGYIPPERTGFVKLGGNSSSDLYSLGVTLYEAAVGSPPFAGIDGPELINRLLYVVPKPLHEIFPDFPLALSDIISKLLRKNPSDRYYSAFGLAADLDRCWNLLSRQEVLLPFALGTKDRLRELNYHIPLIGRKEEMAALHRLFDSAMDGASSLVLIGAPSGTGKSRLAFEILHRAKQHRSLINYVKFSEYERNLPLSAVTLLLAEHGHYLKSISIEQLQLWQQKIQTKLGSRLHLILERYEFYGSFLVPPESNKNQVSESSFQQFNETLGECISLLPACGETQLILIDDLQWADWQSLQVFELVARKIAASVGAKTMLMGTYRSNEITEGHPLLSSLLALKNQLQLIELGPLDRSDSNTLVQYLLDEKGFESTKLQDACFRFTAGNPFYIYEYLKSAIQSGIFALDESNETWKFHENLIHKTDLSTGVAGLVADRIRALNPIQRALVNITSIGGHAMKRSALKHLLPWLIEARQLKEEALQSHTLELTIELTYQELLQKNILTADNERFAFFHDKVQEASYSLLTLAERRILHHHYGHLCIEWMSSFDSKAHDTEIFEAAYHICQGQSPNLGHSTRKFLLLAARAASRVYAYDKAREFLQALIEAIEAQSEIDQAELFIALELLADTLTISDKITAAMQLYDRLLTLGCPPEKCAHIYAKKVELSLNLFDYKEARYSCEQALKVLQKKHFTTERWSFFYIAVSIPFIVCYSLYFRLFGKQTKEIESEQERILLFLLLKSLQSQYFIQPAVAIANLIAITFTLLKYKDCDLRATLMSYWGAATSFIGMQNLANYFFGRAYAYFDLTANPIERGQILFLWAFNSDFPHGDLAAAQKKYEDAILNLAPVGESFWRSLSMLGLITLDYFGAENGQARIRSHELVELWKKVRFAATPLSITLKHYLEVGNEKQIEFLLKQITEADDHIRNQGYDSADSVFVANGMAEYFDNVDQPELADKWAKRAFDISSTRMHRIFCGIFSPIIYARMLTKRGKLFRAFLVLAFA